MGMTKTRNKKHSGLCKEKNRQIRQIFCPDCQQDCAGAANVLKNHEKIEKRQPVKSCLY